MQLHSNANKSTLLTGLACKSPSARVDPISRKLSKDLHAVVVVVVVVERIASLAAILLGSEPRNRSPNTSRATRVVRGGTARSTFVLRLLHLLLEPIVLSPRFKNVSSLSSPNADLIESAKDAATSSAIPQRHKRAI
jgi:hypothetical protein